MKIAAISLFLCYWCASAWSDSIAPDRLECYKTIGDVTLNLHIFNPPNLDPEKPVPAIVFFFGGGWSVGSADRFYRQCEFFRSKGMVAISADYRIKRKHGTSPLESMEDAKSAIRYVRTHAKDLGIDPERIVGSGGSAGGHIAACAGVVPGFEAEGENLEVSSAPNALVLFNPVLNVTKLERLRARFKGKDREASPLYFIREGLPPAIIFHGTKDKTVPFKSIEEYCCLAQEKGNTCVLVSFKGQPHAFFNKEPYLSLTIKRAEKFLREQGFLPATSNEIE